MLCIFHCLDKNLGWITDGNGYEDFTEDYQTCGLPGDVPVEFGGSRGEQLSNSFVFIIDLIVMNYYS